MQKLKTILSKVGDILAVVLVIGVFGLLTYGFVSDPCGTDPFGIVNPAHGLTCNNSK